MIDDLTYNSYNGNKVIKITDAAIPSMTYNNAFHFTGGVDVETEYIYDSVGNLKKDYNKKIVDIRYNSLNLPDG